MSYTGDNDHQPSEADRPLQGAPGDPQRLLIIILCCLCTALSNATRVDITVAILQMEKEYKWSQETAGLVQSAFFWGYILTQLPGGYCADKYGGKLVLLVGGLLTGAMALLTPLAASSGLKVLLAVRAILGAGQGMTLPAINSMVSKRVPENERARALAFIYSGLYAGSFFGLLAAPQLLKRLGWRAIFYVFGASMAAWCVAWQVLVDGKQERKIYSLNSSDQTIPWGRFFTSKAVWAILIAHFCFAWGYFVIQAWFPTYLSKGLGFNIYSSGYLSLVPWVAMFCLSNLAGFISDKLIENGGSVTLVRKGMQTTGFLLPASLLAFLGTTEQPAVAVTLITLALAFGSFSHSGVYANHADIAPQFSGILFGISNTGAAIPGIIGIWLTGFILDMTASWTAVFGIAIGVNVLGAFAFVLLGTGERVFQ